MTFLIQVNEDYVQLSAAGVFKVGVHLISAVKNFILNKDKNMICYSSSQKFEFYSWQVLQ
jgi:hypothetical protein